MLLIYEQAPRQNNTPTIRWRQIVDAVVVPRHVPGNTLYV